MPRKRPFDLSYDLDTKRHLRAIETKYHSLIRKTFQEQLRFEPERPENRFRVLYGVDRDHRELQIQAIGVKERDRLFIAGEEVEL